MKVDSLHRSSTANTWHVPSSEKRHTNVLCFGQLMGMAVAHELEGLCWRLSREKSESNIGFYLQCVTKVFTNVQRHPELLQQFSLPELLLLDNKALNMNKQSRYERLMEAKCRVEKALNNLDIDFDMSNFKPMIRCRYCGSAKYMVTRHEQRRSADEGMTEIKNCTFCKEEWI